MKCYFCNYEGRPKDHNCPKCGRAEGSHKGLTREAYKLEQMKVITELRARVTEAIKTLKWQDCRSLRVTDVKQKYYDANPKQACRGHIFILYSCDSEATLVENLMTEEKFNQAVSDRIQDKFNYYDQLLVALAFYFTGVDI